jgi:hypothetical protein
MWLIQRRDLSEGNGALWSDFTGPHYEAKEDARRNVRQLIAMSDDEDLMQYRVVEHGSAEYYSQPTDRLEY